MLCEKCGVNPAAVTFTKVINGKKSVTRLCAGCAQENSLYPSLDMDMGFSSLFSSFFNESTKAQEDEKCPLCAMTKSQFLSKGKPGCAQCYTTFASSMKPLLRKIHSTTTHTGKISGTNQIVAENKLDSLKAQLKEAIEKEEYEKAARLRDAIKELEGTL